MKDKNIYKILFLSLILAGILNTAFAASISISPGTLYINNALKGRYAEATFRVSNPNDVPIAVTYQTTPSDKLAQWLTAKPGAPFVVNPEQSQIVTLSFTIPEETPNGIYSTIFVVAAAPLSSGGGDTGAVISAAAGLRVNLNVIGDEIVDVDILSSSLLPVEVGYGGEFEMLLKNIGNVDLEPRFVFEVWDINKTQMFLTYEEIGKAIRPFTTEKYLISIPSLGLPKGDYILKVSVYAGTLLIEEREIKFTVYDIGTYTVLAELREVSLTPENVLPGDIVKIEGMVENTGQTSIVMRLVAEITKDGKIVGKYEGDASRVDPKEITDVSLYFTPEEIGKYDIQIWGSYSGKKTNILDLTLQVGKIKSPINNVWLIVVVVLIILGIALILLEKKEREKYSFKGLERWKK